MAAWSGTPVESTPLLRPESKTEYPPGRVGSLAHGLRRSGAASDPTRILLAFAADSPRAVSPRANSAAIAIGITPSSATVISGKTQQFKATVTGAASFVLWSVLGVNGGPAVGTISKAGLYTAPAGLKSPVSIAIKATSLADSTKSQLASVTVVPPVSVAAAPTSASLTEGQSLQLTASVSGGSGLGVGWRVDGINGGNPSVGVVSTAGLYTAPKSIAAPKSVTVTAVSVEDPSRSAAAAITLKPSVKLGLSPSSAKLYAGGSLRFSAIVSGVSDASVTWRLSAPVGAISSAGVYTAPPALTFIQSTFVVATSVADPTKWAQASVTVAPPVVVSVTPATASLSAGQSRQFTASVSGGYQTLGATWSVNGIAGGDAAVGTISPTGLYTAPASIGSLTSVTIAAESVEDPSKSASAAVSLNSPAPVSVSVTPATASLSAGQTQQFTASVSGTTNTGVAWSVSPAVGTVSSTGLYTAPSSIASETPVTVKAVSVADSSKSASAVVTLKPAVTVSVTPGTATLVAGGTQQFTAAVSGTTNTGVTWSVSPTVGTVTSAGLYTAPASIAGETSVTVKAASVADPGKSASAVVTLRPALTVTMTPATAILTAGGSQQFTASVIGATNTAVTWSLSPAVGTLSSTGLYTAPSSIASDTSVTVKAASVADSTKSASTVVTLRRGVTVTVTPATATLPAGGSQQFTASVTGALNTSVTWSLSPAVGTLSSTGLYTAPSATSATQSVSVIATSVADPTKSARATVTIATTTTPATTAGGLVAFPLPVIEENLITNPGFEEMKTGWSDGGFTVDTTIAHSGAASLKVTDPYAIPYTQYAWRDVTLEKGGYRISGWIKTENLGATKAGYVRICLTSLATAGGSSQGGGCTKLINGTTEWTRYEDTQITIAQDTMARLSLAVYGEPDGTAWFDDIELRREQQTLSVFMLYPNYRGILFDDQSQVTRFHVDVDPPDATPVSVYQVKASVVEDGTGRTLLAQSFPAQEGLDVSLDLAPLSRDLPYLVKFTLRDTITGAEYTYPAYRIIRQSASARDSMSVSVDQQNRFLLRGKPSFLLGVYDSGMGYTTLESSWETMFTQNRRLFELPIDLYLNYWYGGTPNNAIIPMMNVLQRHGILNMTNTNCFASATAAEMGAYWFFNSSDSTIAERTAHPGFSGFYAADECLTRVAADTFSNAQRMRAAQSGGIVFGTQIAWTKDLPVWRDILDVIATDPYVISGALPSTGYYPLNKVADAARETNDAVRGSRPFMTTLQFYQNTSNSRWPTQQELRSMSYAAIVEGSNGLFYWSLGARALSYVCSTWCAERSAYFDSLKSVMNELRSIDPVLTALDRPAALASNSNPAIRTRMKQDGDKRYLIVFNTSGEPQTTTVAFSSPVTSISVAGTGSPVSVLGAGFTDTLSGFEPKVYVIQ